MRRTGADRPRPIPAIRRTAGTSRMERCRGTSTSGREKFIRGPRITKALARKNLLHGYRTREFRMKEMPIGSCGVFALEVKPEHLASRLKDSVLPPILATPVMI